MTREEFEYAIKSCGCFIYRGQTYYEESELIKAFEDMGLIEQEPKTEEIIKMRDATPEERESIDKYIKSISKPTVVNFWDLEQEQKYCDRNICLRNEYNGIGCDECEVTKSQEPTDENLHREREQAYMQGYEDASKRFRQEPCEDAISRKVLISHIENQSREWGEDYDVQQILGDIEDMPSVNPQEPKTSNLENPSEDAISRKQAIYITSGFCHFANIPDELAKLPSVTPQPKTGHWIDNHNGTISCSHCHTWFNKDDRYYYMHYCPYCNIKMAESEDMDDR